LGVFLIGGIEKIPPFFVLSLNREKGLKETKLSDPSGFSKSLRYVPLHHCPPAEALTMQTCLAWKSTC